ncbi:hypothetical protein VPH35_081226 [Triticum aestivum]
MDLARRVETQARWPDGSNVRPLTRSISTTTPDGKQHGGDRAAPGDSHGGRRASVCACSSDGWVGSLFYVIITDDLHKENEQRVFFLNLLYITGGQSKKRIVVQKIHRSTVFRVFGSVGIFPKRM